MYSIRRFFFPPTIPGEYRPNFTHLYLDIGWFGILSGSAINFLSVYATRLGATGLQIGLLSSMAAAVSLALAIPAGRWLESQNINKAVFRASIWYRLGYLLWIPLPWLFGEQAQVWALIVIALVMAIPLTPLSVGFNALFAASVPAQWRAHVAGVRNVAFAIAFMLSSLGSGYLLENLPFPAGYQIIFGIGFLGAAMSSLHLYFIKPLQTRDSPLPPRPQPAAIKRALSPRQQLQTAIRFDIWKTPYRSTLLVFLGFHLTQYLAVPLFPLYQVRQLHLTDDQIGIGTALFYLTVLLGSTRLNELVRNFGHKTVTGISVAGLAIYPLLLALSRNQVDFYWTSILGGLNYGILIGSYANYLLEEIPIQDRPAHLAWYYVILNTSVLIGSLTGPLISNALGLAAALILIALLRFLSGMAILKWG
ncbi:MAG: MFS transporter [Anaerolineales bacterium]|nr:MFS transporter [Anaerolineales bacterium]